MQTYTDTDTKTDAHPERRSMIEEGGATRRKKSSREVKGDRCQKEEVTLDQHWTS